MTLKVSKIGNCITYIAPLLVLGIKTFSLEYSGKINKDTPRPRAGMLSGQILCVLIVLNHLRLIPRIGCKKNWRSEVKVAQSCPTLCDPMDYTVHGILWARILERVAFPFTRESSQHRDRTQGSHIAGGFFTS